MNSDAFKWIFLHLLMLIGATRSFKCEKSGNCVCQWDSASAYEITCPQSPNTSFTVQLQRTSGSIQCFDNSSWSEFEYRTTEPLERFNYLAFNMCPLPETSLYEIGQRIGINGTGKLKFNSFKDLGSTLNQRHLSGLSDLTYLDLSSNQLTEVPVNLFADVPKLESLVLRENKLVLPPGIFDKLSNLKTLELGRNMMMTLEPTIFKKLNNLTFLNLWQNGFKELHPQIFDGLPELRSLDLNSNEFTDLPVGIFKSLKSLRILNIYGNQFSTLPKDLLADNRNLSKLILSYNRGNMTTLPDGFLSNLMELKAVVMSNNKRLETLPEDLFWGSTNLENLSLRGNALTTLPKDLFRDAKKLSILDIAENRITDLPDDIFHPITNLRKLNLEKNEITSISATIFAKLSKLGELNLDSNKIARVSSQAFFDLDDLEVVKMSNNFVVFNESLDVGEEILSPFNRNMKLRKLFLAHNNITKFFWDWTVSHVTLEYLDVSWNQIPHISDSDLMFLSNEITVDLTHNEIEQIYLRDMDKLPPNETYSESRNVRIYLDDNPINCSCSIYWFLKYMEGKMHPNVHKAFRIEANLTCHEPSELRGTLLSNLNSSKFTCRPDTDKPEQRPCPDECDCLFRAADMTILANCSYRNLIAAPKEPSRPYFAHVNIELDLRGNSISQLPALDQPQYENVTVLRLSRNSIREVSLNVVPQKLEVLQLDHNNLTRIDSKVLELMRNSTSLKELSLHANRWECDCDSRDFLNFIQTKFKNIKQLDSVTCVGSNKPLWKMTASDLCPTDTASIVGFSLAVALLGLLIGTLAALYYRYQHQVKVWLYAHQFCLWFVTEEELDRDKEYDAFISFSHLDEQFVTEELVAKLEEGPKPFKLCVHYRDWIAGDWIPSQIARSVDQSRRTIVVLSPNFLQSVWGRMEFQAAHKQALSEGRARVIVVLYGDIGPIDNLDPELKAYLTMNTYVKWGDSRFWENLRFALPHPPQVTRKAAKKIFESHQHHIKIHGDKNGLIYPSEQSETPSPTTTPPADTLKTFLSDGSLKRTSVIIDCTKIDSPRPNDTTNEADIPSDRSNYANNIINAQSTPA